MIYVVDDTPELVELYMVVLQPVGYSVKPFNNRPEALAALAVEDRAPDLLITDYYNASMPFETFLDACLRVHPALRILVISGLGQVSALPCRSRFSRFLSKPFTADELCQEVGATLSGVVYRQL